MPFHAVSYKPYCVYLGNKNCREREAEFCRFRDHATSRETDRRNMERLRRDHILSAVFERAAAAFFTIVKITIDVVVAAFCGALIQL